MLSSTFRGDDHSMNDFFHHGKLHWLLAHSKWTSIARIERLLKVSWNEENSMLDLEKYRNFMIIQI